MGRLAASKSLLNRMLLARSYFPDLNIVGESDAEDVTRMRSALTALAEGREVDAGSAGTVLRFMALRASRQPGHHRIIGSRRLFERPQDELLKILRQLGAETRLDSNAIEIRTSGWKMQGDTLLVPSSRSSQFATAVLLNSWDLPFDLFVSLGGRPISEGYWRMSVRLAQELGMRLDFWDGDFRVPRAQKVTASSIAAEIDMSSAFALAAVAAVSGHATILEFPEKSLQPDAIFTEVLARMGVPLRREGGILKVDRAARLNGVSVNLSSAPDLFPVLAALASLADGESEFYGAPQLVHKESNRLRQMAIAIRKLGREVIERDDGLKILAGPAPRATSLRFDTDQDHRLAFAAAVWKASGLNIEIEHPEVVRKSFPEFWSVMPWSP